MIVKQSRATTKAMRVIIVCLILSSCDHYYGPTFTNETDTTAYITVALTRNDTLLNWPRWELSAGTTFISMIADPRQYQQLMSLKITYGGNDSVSYDREYLEKKLLEVGGAETAAFIITAAGVLIVSGEERLKRSKRKQ